jgi:hypothetical protein
MRGYTIAKQPSDYLHDYILEERAKRDELKKISKRVSSSLREFEDWKEKACYVDGLNKAYRIIKKHE